MNKGDIETLHALLGDWDKVAAAILTPPQFKQFLNDPKIGFEDEDMRDFLRLLHSGVKGKVYRKRVGVIIARGLEQTQKQYEIMQAAWTKAAEESLAKYVTDPAPIVSKRTQRRLKSKL